MKIRKWITNDVELRQFLDELGISGQTDNIMRTCEGLANALGLKWNIESDSIAYLADPIMEAARERKVPTKRDIFKISARIFDPLGLLAPSTLLAKLIYQDIWELKTGSDEVVPKSIAASWHRLMGRFASLWGVLIPRRIDFGRENFDVEGLQLHLFCDASERGYGAVAYVRDDCDGESPTMLLCSKNRVCPLPKKALSIPKKELTSILLGTKLARRIISALAFVKFTVFIWTDSMVALHWVHGNPKV